MSSHLSFALAQAISMLQLGPLTVCLHLFISYAQIEASKTKSGLLILRSILTRAFQVLASPLHFACVCMAHSWSTHSSCRRCAQWRRNMEPS